jgi:hypothetical protein
MSLIKGLKNFKYLWLAFMKNKDSFEWQPGVLGLFLDCEVVVQTRKGSLIGSGVFKITSGLSDVVPSGNLNSV